MSPANRRAASRPRLRRIMGDNENLASRLARIDERQKLNMHRLLDLEKDVARIKGHIWKLTLLAALGAGTGSAIAKYLVQ